MVETYGVTKEQFEACKALKRMGITKTWDWFSVAYLAREHLHIELTKEQISTLWEHYQELAHAFTMDVHA